MQSDQTTPPKRIWAEEVGTATKGGQRFRIGRWITDETASHPHEYILASEVAALIAANAALEAKVAGLRAAFRVNMLRFGPPGTSHEEIDAAIDAALSHIKRGKTNG